MVVAYVVPATFGAALLRILGEPPFRLLVLQRAAAAAIDLVVAAAAAIATAAATAVAIAAAAATAAVASASTHPFQLLVLQRVAAAAVVVRWGGQGICSRIGGHPLLEALSIFCMFAAVAVVKYAVQPQAPAAVFIISSADAELAVLSLPRVTILFLGGWKWGTESDSAMNSSSGPRGLEEDQ